MNISDKELLKLSLHDAKSIAEMQGLKIDDEYNLEIDSKLLKPKINISNDSGNMTISLKYDTEYITEIVIVKPISLLNIFINNNNLKFVQSFCSTDNFRLNLTKPTCYESGLVISTNANKLLMFFDESFQETHKENVFVYNHENKIGVNAMPTIEEFVESKVKSKSTSTRMISMKEVDDIIANIRKERKRYSIKYIECNECDGNGKIYCHCCDNENECKNCDGSGEEKVNPESTRGKSPEAYYKYPEDVIFKIDENLMRLQIMSELSESLKIIGKDSLELIKTETNKVYFKIPDTDYYILCMGVTTMENEFQPENIHAI